MNEAAKKNQQNHRPHAKSSFWIDFFKEKAFDVHTLLYRWRLNTLACVKSGPSIGGPPYRKTMLTDQPINRSLTTESEVGAIEFLVRYLRIIIIVWCFHLWETMGGRVAVIIAVMDGGFSRYFSSRRVEIHMAFFTCWTRPSENGSATNNDGVACLWCRYC
jgi:hypothetical protein